MDDPINAIMESASVDLAKMRYLACEAKCLEALRLARDAGRWGDYARILMPLQEARRQRRMIAADGLIRLGSGSLPGDVSDWLHESPASCILLTRPHGQREAISLVQQSRLNRMHVEVLLVDGFVSDDVWRLMSYSGPPVIVEVEAPLMAWRDVWMNRHIRRGGKSREPHVDAKGRPPSGWFIDATEKLGDGALASVNQPIGSVERVAELERCLDVVTDHEILHQRLFDAAMAVGKST